MAADVAWQSIKKLQWKGQPADITPTLRRKKHPAQQNQIDHETDTASGKKLCHELSRKGFLLMRLSYAISGVPTWRARVT